MITLAKPIAVKDLTHLKIQAVKYEDNSERGQNWAEVWCDLGYMAGEPETFVAYPSPATKTSEVYFKFENGAHPAVPGKMLGQCDTCNRWHFKTSGPCENPPCPGIVAPFPSYTRFRDKIDSSTTRDVFAVCDAFLTGDSGGNGQEFPSADDISVVGPLVAGT